MQPIPTSETNLVIAEHQDGVRPLPVHNTGREVVATWEITDEELERLKESKKIYLTISNFGLAIFPHLLTIENPLEDVGVEEGQVCGRDGCVGTMEDIRDTDNGCACHINPPCSHCTTVHVACNVCNESYSNR